MKVLSSYLSLLDEGLHSVGIPNHTQALYEPIEYILSLGGKRIRPALTLMAANLFGNDPKDVLPQAMAVEVFHNFTLLHDDIMDKAPLRRGKQTVHEKWDDNSAILSGDAMQIMAYQLVAQAPSDQLPAILETFSRVALEICEGQSDDMRFETESSVTTDEYVEMIRKKTAVLLGAALELGAIRSGASQADRERLVGFGEKLGLAFQIQDDILDAFADPDSFGKQVGGDILANKKTFLMLSALNLGSEAEVAEITGLMLEPDPELKVKKVKELFISTGALDAAKQLKQTYHDQAMADLAAIERSEVNKGELVALSEFLLDRAI